jgi:thymidylate kinase
MFAVALIGPDGCGKSTISKRLLQDDSFEAKRIYMGINRAESNYALPTTHLIRWLHQKFNGGKNQGGPRDISNQRNLPSGSFPKRFLKELKTALVFFNNTAEEWYRQLLAWYFMRTGKIVIFDRHFYADFYHYDVNGLDSRWTSRLHGYMLEHLYPKPNLVIYLDAPAELLFERKREGTVALLEERRHAYLELQDKVPQFETVDATQAPDLVFADVLQHILGFLQTKKTTE